MGWGDEAVNQPSKITDTSKTKQTDFVSIEEDSKKGGKNILTYGRFSSGKSFFALTAKPPIYVIDTEKGIAPIKGNFEGKKIFVLNCFESDGPTSYEKILEAIDKLEPMVKEGQVGTIVIDSISDLWEFAQDYAKVKVWKMTPLDRVKQMFDWGLINKLYYQVMKRLLMMNCNCVFTARVAEVYAGAGKSTGEEKARCQKDTEHWVDVVIKTTNKFSNGNVEFISIIEKARGANSLVSKTFSNLNFDKLIEEYEKNKEVSKLS